MSAPARAVPGVPPDRGAAADMPDIVESIDPSTIASVIEANINAYLLSFARIPGAMLHDDGQLVWLNSGIAAASFNSVVYANLLEEGVDRGIESVLSHFRERALPLTWHIGPSTRPADLDRSLQRHGLTHDEDEPGMAVELDSIADIPERPPSLTIEPALGDQGLRDWVNVWLFSVPLEAREPYFEALRRRGVGDDLPWRYFVGWLHGEPVAISQLFVAHGVAAVHYVVTKPEARRQGIGAAMTLRVLEEARALRYRVTVLTASPSGIRIYRRFGFQEYCWFRRYGWE